MKAPLATPSIFAPSAASGAEARRQVYARLAESLAHVFDRASPFIDFDRGKADRLVAALEGGVTRFRPRLFARYFDVIAAIDADDDDRIRAALELLIAETADPDPRLKLLPYASHAMDAEAAAIIARHFPLDDLDGARIETVTPADEPAAIARFGRALDMMRDAAPLTFAEITATVSEIVLAAGSRGTDGYTFDGASSLQYWGAILVNASQQKSLLQTCEMIAHEAGHNVLFGMSPRTFFVWNPDNERYVSPLRDDPRPLDGIFHATFVLARMHFAVSELRASGLLGSDQKAEAEQLLAASAASFTASSATLEANARFTDEGRRILSAAEEYMAAAASGGHPRQGLSIRS